MLHSSPSLLTGYNARFIYKRLGTAKPRRGLTIKRSRILGKQNNVEYARIGPSIAHYQPFVASYTDPLNYALGYTKRVFPEHLSDDDLASRFKAFVQSYVMRNFKPIPEMPMSHEYLDSHWLDDSEYTLKQKDHFHFVLDNILEEPRLPYRNLRNKTFIKKEFYTEVKHPRIINGRCDELKVAVAPYIKDIEHVVIYNKHFIKGNLPSQTIERMNKILSRYTHIYETDYSSFEGSFTDTIINSCERVLFSWMLQNNVEIKKLVMTALGGSRQCCARNCFSAYCEGSRMSGDQWTSLANGFTNQMLFLFMASQEFTDGQKYDYLVEGDDGFLASTHSLDLTIPTRLGFKLKLLHGRRISDVSFCGLCPMPSGRLCPHFWETVLKHGYTFDPIFVHHDLSSPVSQLRIYELLRAKAMSLAASASHVPILGAIAKQQLKVTEGYKPAYSEFDWWDRNVLGIFNASPNFDFSVDERDREFFEYRYHIPIDTQKLIEQQILAQTSLCYDIALDDPYRWKCQVDWTQEDFDNFMKNPIRYHRYTLEELRKKAKRMVKWHARSIFKRQMRHARGNYDQADEDDFIHMYVEQHPEEIEQNFNDMIAQGL